MQFVYVALLRGINVGGNNILNMKALKDAFEKEGLSNVKTYINSGNIIFQSPHIISAAYIEQLIQTYFAMNIKALLRSKYDFIELAHTIPMEWQNNADQKTDVLFLWEEIDHPDTLKLIIQNEKVDCIMYLPGAIIWHIEKINYSQSGMNKFVGSNVYKQMTARNINTVRKLVEMLA
jgi:uncharacterized protein (DUF1697 family)